MFGSAVWFLKFSLLADCYQVQRRLQLILYQNICCLVGGVLLCNCYMGTANNSNKTWHVLISVVDNMVYMGTVNNSKTWHVLISVVDNMVYMGTVNNSKTWHVLISVVDNMVHGYSQQ